MLIQELLAILEGTDQRKFKVKWVGYPKDQKKQDTVGIDFFSDDNGFDEDDIEAIQGLSVNEEHEIGGMHDHVEITRIK